MAETPKQETLEEQVAKWTDEQLDAKKKDIWTGSGQRNYQKLVIDADLSQMNQILHAIIQEEYKRAQSKAKEAAKPTIVPAAAPEVVSADQAVELLKGTTRV